MKTANMLVRSNNSLAPELQVAQDAIRLPEVQEMLRRLSEYNLGIYMPHMHEEKTGNFLPIPDDMVQVETELEVSFKTEGEIAAQPERFVQVGWIWRDGEVSSGAACKQVCVGTGPRHEWSHR